MKFVIAPDKFKGSLTGSQFCDAVENGLKSVLPEVEIIKLPLADGGDGTIEILEQRLNGSRIKLKVNDPLFRPIESSYLLLKSKNTAFIEMAEASGMKLLKQEDQNCFYTTSLGTGDLILDAINKGAKTIILGIGGSATNDCGIGMASALGFKFEDKNGNTVLPIGKNLSHIEKIDSSNVHPELNNIDFKVACDVTNPLFGPHGAAHVYGHQKGASESQISLLDNGLEHISNIFMKQFKINVQEIEGSGAAGGMGAAAQVFLKGRLQSGIDLVKELVAFDNKIKNSDWIITGEGKLDSQTLSGKTIQGVMDSAKKQKIPVAVFCGSIELSTQVSKGLGISYMDAIMSRANSLEDAMKNSSHYVKEMAKKFALEIRTK